MGEPFVARVIEFQGARIARSLFDDGRQAPADESLPIGAIVKVQADGLELLAEPDTARAGVYGIFARHGIDPIHPPAVREEVAQILAAPGLDDDALEDRTGHPYVTIDNEDSRDLDQALFVERLPTGYRVHYALADAAYYVRQGSELLEEAIRRGTSYYLPGTCVPMLPVELSEGLVSLNPDVDRRALVFLLDLNAEGRSVRTELVRARVRSRAKLTYDGVQAFHDEPDASPLADREFTESLRLLREVGELRIDLARERGVVPFNRTSLELGLDAEGSAFEVGVRERNDCERWNEQISLLCNMEGAELFQTGAPLEHVQPVYRVHPPPLAGRIDQLVSTIDELVSLQELDPQVWRWRRGAEGLAEYLGRLEGSGNDRVRATIQRQIRYLNRASEFTAESGPHHALGVDGYARFSSPMREVVGIFTHKEGLERLGLASTHSATDASLRERAIRAGNEAKKRQRKLVKEANKLAIDQLLASDLERPLTARAERAATIFGIRGSRLYVELDAVPIELKVYRRDLERCFGSRYRANDAETVLEPVKGEGPTFRLGAGVLLTTREHDPERQRWSFVPRLLVR